MTPLDVVLRDVAAPLVALGRFSANHVLQIAAAIWNISRLPDSCPRESLLLAVARSAQGELDEALTDAVRGVYRLAAEVHAQDHRVVGALPA